jgi:uncharacterized lipoprotein NlpE involved in copper resistance
MKRSNTTAAAFVMALAAVVLIGCGKQAEKPGAGGHDTATVTAQGADTSHSQGASTTSGAATSDVGVKSYTFHGKITKIDKVNGSVEVDHESIPGYAEAGTQSFKVANPQLIETLAVGHETHFTIRVAGDVALLTGVQDGHDEKTEH